MPIESTVRTRRPSAALLALQSAVGTPVDDLRIASGAVRVWTQKAGIPAGRAKNDPHWRSEKFASNVVDRVTIRDEIDGKLFALATPESIKAILQNNWGPMSGTPLASVLSSTVNQYATLAWVEDYKTTSKNLIRLADVFLYRLKFLFNRREARLLLEADYAARSSQIVPLASLGSIQISAAPMTPADIRVYNVRNATFVRDPAGVNISLDFVELEIIVDQQVSSEWTFSAGWDVWKQGNTLVYVRFKARLSDEFWAIITDARAGTMKHFKITATTDTGSPSMLTIDLFNLDWEFEDIGHLETPDTFIMGTGRAFLSAQPAETGFVKFTVS